MNSEERIEKGKDIPSQDKSNGGKFSFLAINQEMFRYKLHFFLYTAGFGTTFPYGSVIGVTQYGLTAGNLAATYVVQKILTILIRPLIGYCTDYFNSLKASIVALACLHAIFYFGLIVIPERDITDSMQQTRTFNNDSACRLCEISAKTFLDIPFNGSFLEEELKCFSDSALDVTQWHIYCNNQVQSSSPSSKIGFTALKYQARLNGSLGASKACRNNLHNNDAYFSLISYNRDSESVNIICFSTKKKQFDSFNSTSLTNYSFLGDRCQMMQNRGHDAFKKSKHFKRFTGKNITCDTFSHDPEIVEESTPKALYAFETYQYYLFSLCLLGANMFGLAIQSLSDTACHEAIHNTESSYGQQRFWGSLSWGIMAPLAGLLNDYTGGYMASGFVMTAIFALLFWNLSGIQLKKPEFSRGRSGKDLKSVLGSRRFMVFEIGVFMNGLFCGMIWSHLAWWYTTIGGSRLVVGLCYAVESLLGEAPFYFFSRRLIEMLGHFNVVSLALFAHGVRFFLYSWITNPWYALPVEALEGVTHGLFYVAITSFGKLSSKPGIEASTQTIITLTYDSLGAGVGSLLSGVSFELLGSQSTFRYTSFVCVAAGSINVLLTVLLNFRPTQSLEKPKMSLDNQGQPLAESETLVQKPQIVRTNSK